MRKICVCNLIGLTQLKKFFFGIPGNNNAKKVKKVSKIERKFRGPT